MNNSERLLLLAKWKKSKKHDELINNAYIFTIKNNLFDKNFLSNFFIALREIDHIILNKDIKDLHNAIKNIETDLTISIIKFQKDVK